MTCGRQGCVYYDKIPERHKGGCAEWTPLSCLKIYDEMREQCDCGVSVSWVKYHFQGHTFEGCARCGKLRKPEWGWVDELYDFVESQKKEKTA